MQRIFHGPFSFYRIMRYLLIILAVIYLIVPFDLIPDFTGVFGFLDDLAVLAFTYFRYRAVLNSLRQAAREARGERQAEPQSNNRTRQDPYDVLGLRRGASPEEIEEQYRKLMTQYHPDKVNHLGPELKKVAHEKTIEIQEAYRAIKSRR